MTISTWFSRRAAGGGEAERVIPAPAQPPAAAAAQPRVAAPVARAETVPVLSDSDDDATLMAVVAALSEPEPVPEPVPDPIPEPHAKAFSAGPPLQSEAQGAPLPHEPLSDADQVPDAPAPPADGADEAVGDVPDPQKHADTGEGIAESIAEGAPDVAEAPEPVSDPALTFDIAPDTDPDTDPAPAAEFDTVRSPVPDAAPRRLPAAPTAEASPQPERLLPEPAALTDDLIPEPSPLPEAPLPLPLPLPLSAPAIPSAIAVGDDDSLAEAIRSAAVAEAQRQNPGPAPARPARRFRFARHASATARGVASALRGTVTALRGLGAASPATRAFALATLAPVPLFAGAVLVGGPVPYLALAYLTVFTFTMDELSGLSAPTPRGAEDGDKAEAQAADRLLTILAATHLILLATAVIALSGHADLSVAGWIATFLAFGLWFGQVSNAAAHEMIHRADPRLRALGGAVFTTLLFGHHASAHRLVHHRHVATPDDPNSAEAGESFWQFAPRAWAGSFTAGWEMERQMQRARIGRRRRRVDPYILYIGGAALAVALVAAVAGLGGVLVYAAIALHAQVQLLLSDYVQHYGLSRRKLASGRYEPVGPQHSWDAPEGLSALAMLNAARHGDHHARPTRPAARLERAAGGRTPVLPHSLPIMCTAALWPPLWRRMMDARVSALRPRADGLRL